MRYHYRDVIFIQDWTDNHVKPIMERGDAREITAYLSRRDNGEDDEALSQTWPTWRGGAGSRDYCELVRHRGETYLLTVNHGLRYVGLDRLLDVEHTDPAVRAYLDCLLWLDGCGFDVDDLPAEVIAQATADVADFVALCTRERITLSDLMSPEQFGHDFALTRNRHGAGFWDRGYGDVGDRLTALAHPYGGVALSFEGGEWIYE